MENQLLEFDGHAKNVRAAAPAFKENAFDDYMIGVTSLEGRTTREVQRDYQSFKVVRAASLLLRSLGKPSSASSVLKVLKAANNSGMRWATVTRHLKQVARARAARHW